MLNNCYRLKLCVDHLMADTACLSEDGRGMRFCRKCHRLEDVALFEVRVATRRRGGGTRCPLVATGCAASGLVC